MTNAHITERLRKLFSQTPVVSCGSGDRFVILSDLHLGDGSSRDDFSHNADLLKALLSQHYLPKGFQLVLNGDIEELHRFPLKSITAHWEQLYRIFYAFQRRAALHKLLGNHDWELHHRYGTPLPFPHQEALRLRFGEQEMLILHGHQADRMPHAMRHISGFVLRRIATPLGIGNYSVAFDKMKKYQTEKRIYDFARRQKILAIIGHTHRPLFESLSRVDYLKFQIETLCRAYPAAPAEQKTVLAAKIGGYRQDLQHTLEKDRENGARSSLYNTDPLVPCIFNSGCGIGKRGITAVEIANGRISLTYWFDRARTTKYFTFNGYAPEALANTPFFRVPLKEDSLEYIFARIKLLS